MLTRNRHANSKIKWRMNKMKNISMPKIKIRKRSPCQRCRLYSFLQDWGLPLFFQDSYQFLSNSIKSCFASVFISQKKKRAIQEWNIVHLVKASVSSSRVFGLRQESPDRLDVFSIFSFFTNSSSFFLTTSSCCCCFLAGSSFFLTKSSCLRMMERFLASATEGGNGDCESLSRGEARPVVCKKNWRLLNSWWC